MIKLLRLLSLAFTLVLVCSTASIAQLVNFEDTWKEYLDNEKASNISKLVKPKIEQKTAYAKYCMMYATVHFCADDLETSRDLLSEIETIGATTYEAIPRFVEKYEDLLIKIKAYDAIDKLWGRFIYSHDVTLEELEIERVRAVCEKGTLAKYSYMAAYANLCKGDLQEAKTLFEKRVLTLAERTSFDVNNVRKLPEEVKMMKQYFKALSKLGPAWKEFVETGESNGFDEEFPIIKCYAIPNMKAYTLIGASDICKLGAEMLGKVRDLEDDNDHALRDDLVQKIDWLQEEVNLNSGDEAQLNKAWKEFLVEDTLTSGIKYGYNFCNKEATIKAYLMDGYMDVCNKGQAMLDKVKEIRAEYSPSLHSITRKKIDGLKQKVEDDIANKQNLEMVWKQFIAAGDTLTTRPSLANFYCDKVAQVRYWTLKGHLDACASGQGYIDQIDQMTAAYALEYDAELACRITRLKIKVWDCRYWELVLQARKETHEERERFGPLSALNMKQDLNSDKQPCETDVLYEPLGNIGIKYTISTYMCQNIDLAKMGDPEYYKKIATWVDSEVLQEYCESNMRCKEDFFIYLEGHTDGHRFGGAYYKQSLDIPKGTYFTHYHNDEVKKRVTIRDITHKLASNLELGLARAWTVQKQLAFMEVPITIGAFEHMEDEKGGEYRKVDIELNITNLLLDFYEKRLAELLVESGIGERPEECND